MSKLTLLSLLLISQAAQATPQACGGHGDPNSLLVSTTWLADHLKDPDLVILAVGQRSEFDSGHIPGARFLEYMDTHLMKSPAGLTMELRPIPDLVEVFSKLGVSNDSHVVLYMTKDAITATGRVFMTLDVMGLGARTSILDGGFPIWKADGRAVSTEANPPKRGKLQACPQDDVIADFNYVQHSMKQPGVTILDARQNEYYTGAKNRDGERPGHIPGASSLPFEQLMDENGKLKSPEALKAEFERAGVKPGDKIVTYCHIGQRASLEYFVARYLGYDARLYDGSWDQWGKQAALPVETSVPANR